jgi:hypothetical protein
MWDIWKKHIQHYSGIHLKRGQHISKGVLSKFKLGLIFINCILTSSSPLNLSCLSSNPLLNRWLTPGVLHYSWWLPSPSWPRAWRIVEWLLVIVAGSDQLIVRGSCAFLAGDSQKSTLVDCSWHWVSSHVLVLMVPLCRARRVMPINAWATKWVCRHSVD